MALKDERSIGVNIAAHFDEGSLLNATRRIASMVEVLKQEMNSSDFHNYYKDVDALAKAVENAYRAFEGNRSQDSALNLVKAFNALAALDKNRLSNLSDLMPDLSGAVDSAKDLAGALANAFREENFREAFATFDSIKENGGDVIKLFERVGQSAESTAELRRTIERLADAYSNAVAEADELRERVRKLEDDSSVGALTKKLEEAESELLRIRSAAEREFETYLRSNDISPLQTDKLGNRVFGKYFDQIRDGSMTAKQAIAAVKREFASLFDDRGTGVGAEALGTISVRLDDILRKYEELSAQIREAGAGAPMERIGEAAEAGSDVIERQGETIREVASQRSAINDLNDLIGMLVSISTQAEGSTSSLYEQIIPLLEAIREFDTIDPSKLQSIGKIFEGLSGVNGFKISSAQAKNLKEFLDSVSTIGDVSALRSISGVNLKGFNDLSIKETSLKNLATYLPTIASVNVDNLEKLQRIDLSNFASLKVPKIDTEAISGLGKLGDALNQVRDSADALSKTIGAAGTSTARSLHQMSGAGLSHEEILGRLQSGIGHTGASRARTAAMKLGFTNEDAKELAETLEHTYALIDDIKVHWKDFDDGVRTVDWVEVQGKSEEGIDIKERLRYLQAVNEEGKKYWKIQREGLDHYKASKQETESPEEAARKEQEAIQRQIEEEANAARQAETELTKLRALRIDYQDQIDRAEDLGIDNDTVRGLKAQADEIDKLIPELEKAASGQDKMTISMDAYKDSVKRAKDELTLLKKQLSVDIKTSGAFVPMTGNQRETALTTIDTRRKEARQQIDRAAGLGLENTGAVDVLKNNLIPLYDELEEKVKDGSISQKEYNETLRRLVTIAGNVNTELNPEIRTMSELDTQYQKLAESMRETQDNARNSVSGAWVEATDEQKASLDNLIARQNALGEAWKNGTLTSEQLGNEVGQITEEYNNLTDAVNREYQARNKAHKNTLDEMNARRGLNQEINNAAKLLRDYSAAEHSRNQSSRDAYKAIEDNIKGMNELGARYERGEIDLRTLQEEQRKYSNEIVRNSAVIRQNGDDHMTAFGKIGRAIKTHLTTLTATASIGSIMRYIRQMVEAVREIDTAMTELRKVTDETDARYEQFLDNAATRAKSLSATISDTVSATADFARLGLSIDEAEKAADAAIVYKAVGDDIASIGDAAESIISTMKAFGVEASDAMSIVDKFNKVGNEFAIGSSGVGEALKRSASAMYAANNTLEETIGLATAANTILQNPQSVGTTLKTVSMYVRAAKTELEAAGEDTEGIAESTGKLRELIMAITREGGKAVDIMADENRFKSTYQILEEISEVWDKISDTNQAALLEKLGGKRNANAIAAILENFEIAQEAMEAATNAEGSAMAELAKYQESIEGHIVALKTAFQELSSTVVDSDLVKFVVDFARVLLEAVNAVVKLVDSLGGLRTVLISIAALKLISVSQNWLATVAKLKTGLAGLSGIFGGLKTGMSGFLSMLNPVTIGIAGVATALNIGISIYQKYKREQEEGKQKIRERAEAAKSEGKEITDLFKKYGQLSEAVKTDKTQAEELKSTRDKLIEALGLEAQRVDTLTGNYEALTDAQIRNKTLSELKSNRIDLNVDYNLAESELLEAAKKSGANQIDSSELGGYSRFEEEAIQYFQKLGYIKDYATNLFTGQISSVLSGFDLSSVDGVIKAYDTLNKMLDTLQMRGLENSELFNDIYAIYSNLTPQVNAYNAAVKALNDNLFDSAYIEEVLGKKLPETEEEFKILRRAMIETIRSSGKFVGSVHEIGSALDEFLSKDQLFSRFYTSPIDDSGTEGISRVSDLIEEYLKKFKVLSGAWKEFSANSKITLETMKLLNETFGEENGLIDVSNGALGLNAAQVDKLNKELYEENILLIASAGATDDQIQALHEMSSALNAVADAETDVVSDIKDLLDIIDKLNEGTEYSTLEILQLIKKYPELRRHIVRTADGYKIEEQAIRDIIKAKADYISITDKQAAATAKTTFVGTTSSAGAAKVRQNAIKSVDDLFAKYEAETGGPILSLDEYIQYYAKVNNHPVELVQPTPKLIEYINALIDENLDKILGNTLVDEIVDPEKYAAGVTPEKETSSSSSSTEKEETEFEKAYKLHQHYLAMNQETEEQYLSWLEGAYKASYAAGEMELDDYYKYEEEVYEKRKELFSRSLDETQHQIDLLSHQMGDTSQEQIALYERMQKKVNQQANAYRAAGIKENDELIRELQNQWWQYEENIRQLRESAFSDWLNDKKFLIDQLKQDGASSDEIVNSWKEVLTRINDEIAYYLSKGYDITSDVIQNLMGELKDAKDSITDALDEIVSKANEVVDGFQNVYTTLTSAAKEYASTGYLSVDSLQSILELGPKYMDMLYDESGQLTINEEALQKVIAARTEEMAAETALSYAKQVLLATEGNESQKLKELTDVQAASSSATWDMAYATLGYAKALGATKGISDEYYEKAIQYVTRMQSVTKTATDSISAYYKTLDEGYVSQADGLETILKLTEDMLKQENSDRIKQLEDEKDAYKDIIDQKKEILRLTKEQQDHDRDMADKLKEISDLQSKIDQLALDDSREARAQRSKLEEQLLEKQKTLTDSQNDYAYDAQVDALDKQYEEYEKGLDKQTDALKEELNSAEKLYQAAIDRISNGWDTLYDDLLNWNYNYGSTLQKDLVNAWEAAKTAAERYGDFVSAMEGVKQHDELGEASYTPSTESVRNAVAGGASTLTNYIDRMRANSLAWFTAEDQGYYEQDNRNAAAEYKAATGNTLNYKNGSWYQNGSSSPIYTLSRDEVGNAVVAAMKANSAAWKNASGSEQTQLSRMNETLAKRLSDFLGVPITKTPGGVWMLGNTPLYEVTKFHTGGIVGGRGSLRQNEVMALLKKGESVLDEKREQALYKTVDFVQVLSDKIGRAIDKGKLSSLLSGTSQTITKNLVPALAGGGIGTMNFSPTISVTIAGAGDLNESTARKYGTIAANTALEQLKSAFTQRGISAAGNSILK